MTGAPYIAVVGPGEASAAQLDDAETVGRDLAAGGAVVVCGGLGGVMEAACRGAKEAGGTTLGILPGAERSAANAFVAVAGEFGTLSEIALALTAGKPVIGLGTWDLGRDPDPIVRARDSSDAAARALAAVR